MSSSQFPEENRQFGTQSVTLTDEAERSLECYVEHSLKAEDSNYLLLMPIDSPVVIIAWDDDEEASEATLLEEDTEIDQIFDDAKAVLAEQNLTLKRTAYTLTVVGELPPLEEDEILTLEMDEDEHNSQLDSLEEFQFLTSFFYQEQEYAVYTPLSPLLFFARQNQAGQLKLLSPEEFREVKSLLEDLLFDELE